MASSGCFNLPTALWPLTSAPLTSPGLISGNNHPATHTDPHRTTARMMSTGCPFCMRSSVLEKNEVAIAFPDAFPASGGHTAEVESGKSNLESKGRVGRPKATVIPRSPNAQSAKLPTFDFRDPTLHFLNPGDSQQGQLLDPIKDAKDPNGNF